MVLNPVSTKILVSTVSVVQGVLIVRMGKFKVSTEGYALFLCYI